MKKTLLITGILLMLVTAGNINLNAQGNMGVGPDSLRMNRPGREMNFRQMGHRGNFGMHQNGMRDHMNPDQFGLMGWGNAVPEKNRIEFIKSLTEKQKAELFDLVQQHREEMKKLHQEMFSKMKVLRENQRNAFLGILTDQQKKLIEPMPAKPNPGAPKEK